MTRDPKYFIPLLILSYIVVWGSVLLLLSHADTQDPEAKPQCVSRSQLLLQEWRLDGSPCVLLP